MRTWDSVLARTMHQPAWSLSPAAGGSCPAFFPVSFDVSSHKVSSGAHPPMMGKARDCAHALLTSVHVSNSYLSACLLCC